jgi:hypothetical protein
MDDDHRLLELEIDTIYGLASTPTTQPRRLAPSDIALAFGWSPNASVIALNQTASALIDMSELCWAEQFAPETEPSVVTLVKQRLLEADPASEFAASGGPSYVFPDSVPDQHVGLPIIVSDAPGLSKARQFIRPDNWQPGEWSQLISGEIGQWAMAVDGSQPVSICHTPAATTAGAEAGVWTRADHRRAGLAGAVTVAWWKREHSRHRTIFYSTRSDNLASRAVARKLGLQPLGWLWVVK